MKTIGKSPAAKVALAAPKETSDLLAGVIPELRELLNVSQLTVEPHAEGETDAVIAKADGQKCERCWHWETDIGASPKYPTLCGRCVAALGYPHGFTVIFDHATPIFAANAARTRSCSIKTARTTDESSAWPHSGIESGIMSVSRYL